jgi:hypothetical protein
MKIVLFTLANTTTASDKIAINSDKIISIFESLDPDDKKKKKLHTAIYAGQDLTWIVKEPIEEVIKKLNDNY